MASLHIQVEQIGIGRILKNYTLKVPPHQREYSWTQREVTALFHDLGRAIADGADAYFLGSIVTIPRGTTAMLDVVDGQQRLATTAILLAAIRDYLKERGDEEVIAADIQQHFLTSTDRDARDTVSKITLNVTDHEFFDQRIIHSVVMSPRRPTSHKLIAEAAVEAKKHVLGVLAAHSLKNHGDILNKWINYIEENAQVVLLKVSDEANAYRMFETLNDRGLRTTQADLIKNHVFGEAGARLSEAQQRWTGMRAVLESFGDRDVTLNFLRQMLISLYGYMKHGDVYDRASEHSRGATKAIKFLTQLEAGASDYAAILNPEHEKWNNYPPAIRQAVTTLDLVRMGAMRPVLLSIARMFSPKEADRGMRVVIRLSVRLIIAGGATSAARSGSVEEPLGDAAQKISDKRITTADELLKELEGIAPNDTQFNEGFAVATATNAQFARYYLRALEMTHRRQRNALYLEKDPVGSLEHVLPINPGGQWPQFSEEEADVFCKRLGNLALLDAKSNSDLKSLGFDAKRKVYAKSSHKLTAQLATLGAWTKKEIGDRQRAMAALAVKTWPLSAD